jgi:glycerol-3-phosphate dehydrogenase (NAD(P)+)
MKTTVISDGAWGTALATVLCENGHDVTMWGPFPDYIEIMKDKRENIRFLPGIPLPSTLKLSDNMAAAVKDSEIIVLATPSQFMRASLEELKECYDSSQVLVNVAKGIENGTLKRMSELCDEILGKSTYTVLSGPSHAEEVVKQCPTAVVVASESDTACQKVQEAFMNKYFRVYSTEDIVSVELGGALKNVMAIAAGIIDGMGIGDNPKAALITRGIAEMSRLGTALGGRQETFAGMSGIGDLIVTCTSGHSRNRHVGEELGKGQKIEDITEAMGLVVAEGVKTSKSAYALAQKVNVETPIVNEVYATLYKGKDPHVALRDLMTRKARTERDDK